MYVEHDQLDQELATLADAVRTGDHMMACLRLAELALQLDWYIRYEERALSLAPSVLAKIHGEHASLRRLVSLIASALDRADDRRGLEAIGKLRSVLLLHVAKEAVLLEGS